MPSTSQRHGAVLAVLSVASLMASLDLFIVNVAFDDIGRDFAGSSLGDLSWILNAYAILYAALLVPLGRLADRYGQKQGFLAGLALFTVSSAACAASPGLWWLVAFRGLQAVGAAALTPTSLGLLINATPVERRQRAVRIWAATGALAAAAGPVVGGLLVSASWRWVFLVNLPIGVASFVAAQRVVPASRHDSSTKVPDVVGSGVLVVAIGAVALGLVKGPDWGWSSAGVVVSLAVGVAGALVFWRRSFTVDAPVVEPALMRVRPFAWANLTAIAFSAAFAAGLLSNILWLQQVWGWSALRTGFGVAPGPLMVPVLAAVSQRVAHRVPAGWIAAAGCTLFGLGAVLALTLVGPDPSYATEVLPAWIVTGAGVGLALPTILSAATLDLPPARAATGSAVINMSRQLGSVLGVSVLIALLGRPGGYADAHAHFVHAWWTIAAVSAVGAVAAVRMTPLSTRVVVAPVAEVARAA